MNQCIVKGCTNKRDEGNFVGDMCVPCYEMITTGEIYYGNTFIHELNIESCKYKKLIENLTILIEKYTRHLQHGLD